MSLSVNFRLLYAVAVLMHDWKSNYDDDGGNDVDADADDDGDDAY